MGGPHSGERSSDDVSIRPKGRFYTAEPLGWVCESDRVPAERGGTQF